MIDSVIHFLRPALLHVLEQELEDRFAPEELETILDDTMREYDAQGATIPDEPSSGGQLMVHLAALTIGLYRAFVARGSDAAEARALTTSISGNVYGRMAAVPTASTKLGGSPHDRVQRATKLFRSYPFSEPSYHMVDVDVDDPAVVAFDVRRCPVAEYFHAQGLDELCVQSWCDLDFPLAERWGATLERTTTIAGGSEVCDFRWRANEEP